MSLADTHVATKVRFDVPGTEPALPGTPPLVRGRQGGRHLRFYSQSLSLFFPPRTRSNEMRGVEHERR